MNRAKVSHLPYSRSILSSEDSIAAGAGVVLQSIHKILQTLQLTEITAAILAIRKLSLRIIEKL